MIFPLSANQTKCKRCGRINQGAEGAVRYVLWYDGTYDYDYGFGGLRYGGRVKGNGWRDGVDSISQLACKHGFDE